MKASEANRIYLARDVYYFWRRRIRQADSSITVYSPFFNKSLLSLLGNTSLRNDKITIVTELNPVALLQVPSQLLTLKRALSEGIAVLTTPGLHAKVLLIDDRYITVGSQNFTSRGRKNKECTSVPREAMSTTHFVDTLIQWRKDAETIDEDFIDKLLSMLRVRFKQYRELTNEVQADFDQLAKQHKAAKQKAIRERVEELERRSRFQIWGKTAYASIEEVPCESENYNSLVADYKYDLTLWAIQGEKGEVEPHQLDRLHMYPVFIAETNRLGFARIAKTRITYIRNTLLWANRELQVESLNLTVTINFPEIDTDKRNIIANLKHPLLGSCKASFLFDGNSANLASKEYANIPRHLGNAESRLSKILDNHFFSSQNAINAFFNRFFTNFKYNEIGIGNKNIESYLTGTRFRLSVIEFQSNPFLVIMKIR